MFQRSNLSAHFQTLYTLHIFQCPSSPPRCCCSLHMEKIEKGWNVGTLAPNLLYLNGKTCSNGVGTRLEHLPRLEQPAQLSSVTPDAMHAGTTIVAFPFAALQVSGN